MITFTNEERKLIERRRGIIENCNPIKPAKLTEHQIALLSLWEPGAPESDESFKRDLSLLPTCGSLEVIFRTLYLNKLRKDRMVRPIDLTEAEKTLSLYHELGHSLFLRAFFNRDPLFIILLGVEVDYGSRGILRLTGLYYNNYPPDLLPAASWKDPFLKYLKLSVPPPLQRNYANLFIGLGGVVADIIFNNVSYDEIIDEVHKGTKSRIDDLKKFFTIVEREKLPIDEGKTVGILNELIEMARTRMDYVTRNSELLKINGVLTNENFI